MTKKQALSTRPTANNQAAQTASASRRQCPSCGRRAAIVTDRQDWGDRFVIVRHCRWCHAETVTDL